MHVYGDLEVSRKYPLTQLILSLAKQNLTWFIQNNQSFIDRTWRLNKHPVLYYYQH